MSVYVGLKYLKKSNAMQRNIYFLISLRCPIYIFFHLQCPVCHEEFNENIALMSHLYGHAVAATSDDATPQCAYCLARFATQDELDTHLKHNHPADTKSPELFTYACLICEVSDEVCNILDGCKLKICLENPPRAKQKRQASSETSAT